MQAEWFGCHTKPLFYEFGMMAFNNQLSSRRSQLVGCMTIRFLVGKVRGNLPQMKSPTVENIGKKGIFRSSEDNSESSKNGKNHSPKTTAKRKLKILCLHGYRQDAETFRSKCGAFRKMTKNYAEYTFITAPHQAPRLPNTPEDEDIKYQKSWWFNKDDGTFKGTNIGGPALGFEESLKFVEKVWKEQGSFDGILGFSQGACFTTIICALAAKQLTIIQPKFVILISGFESGSLVHKGIYETELPTIKSLHIFGENDEIIPSEMSKKLLDFLPNGRIVTHSGGHYIPAAASRKPDYISFMENVQFHCLTNEIIKDSTDDFQNKQKEQRSFDDT